MIEIKKTVGSDYRVALDDVYNVKSALNTLGYYKKPEYGITPYPDEKMFNAIKSFQKDEDLKVDGVMKPNGETIEALNKRISDDPGVRSPTIWCPKCGGPHGGSKGDLCPDCTDK